MSSNKRNALGRGLSALLEDSKTDITSNAKAEIGSVVGSVASIPIEHIEANPFQPRTQFEEQALLELSESIREHGIIQPVTVRKLGYGKYQLISGERRFRASKLAGLTVIPAYIRIANDQAMLEMAIVENIQRENLDAIEVAISYQRLIEECNLTQEALSKKVSKQRSTITNFLRLLKLPADIQVGKKKKKITMGHAKTILSLGGFEKQNQLHDLILQDDLSVREAEEAALKIADKVKKRMDPPRDFYLEQLAEKMQLKLGTKVTMQGKGTKGRIQIDYYSLDDLDRVLALFNI